MINHDRKAIEALRTGVPIREVIDLLGSGQPELEERFTKLLQQKKRGDKTDANGFVFFGGFGTGKSHVLEAFTKIAIDSNFVVSRATISSNLKLGTPKEIIKALVSNTQTKAHLEDGLERLLADALADHKDLSSLISWLEKEVQNSRINSVYLGIAKQLSNDRYGSETFEVVIDFLRGGSVNRDLKRLLRDSSLTTPTEKMRPSETAAFLTRLFISLGYSGWVVLFDELELIRLLGLTTRGRSYSELAHWMGYNDLRPNQGLTVIGCMTAGYVQERIDWTHSGPSELSTIPPRMNGSNSTLGLSSAAIHGMELLQSWDSEDLYQLNQPSVSDIQRIQEQLMKTYEAAYGMNVDQVATKNLEMDPMRVHIRRWIVSWDLQRQGAELDLYNNYVVQTYATEDEEDSDEENSEE
jgi:hypothetical protein